MMMETLEGVSMEIPMKCGTASNTCNGCEVGKGGGLEECVERLSAEVQRLRDEREKVIDVWKDAPDRATEKTVTWSTCNFRIRLGGDTYTRELPKTIEQEIATEICKKYGLDSMPDIDTAMVEAMNLLKERTK